MGETPTRAIGETPMRTVGPGGYPQRTNHRDTENTEKKTCRITGNKCLSRFSNLLCGGGL